VHRQIIALIKSHILNNQIFFQINRQFKMSYICFFDLIPVELLDTIFTYFFAQEILHSFSELTSLESIFSNLHKLIKLHSVSFNRNTTRYIFRGLETDGVNEVNRISSLICNSYILIIPRLNRLHLGTSEQLKTIKFPYLLQLKLEKCSMDDLKTILLQASLLKSLDICLEKCELICNFTVTSTQFTRLHLTIDMLQMIFLMYKNGKI